ncbi:MAG: hypothetical protein LR011_01905, partial [Verrucomicrobia bacterium]|nr:hypothetical protein [Verrucomicrobiota bacterium]
MNNPIVWIEPIQGLLDQLTAPWEPEHERKSLLQDAVHSMAQVIRQFPDDPLRLTFICTHNSRRSHLSQVLAQLAADYYFPHPPQPILTYSGGTEATACNERTIRAFRKVGFSIVNMSGGDNPVYLLQYAENRPVLELFSKVYDQAGNPEKDYVAFLTCDHANANCPSSAAPGPAFLSPSSTQKPPMARLPNRKPTTNASWKSDANASTSSVTSPNCPQPHEPQCLESRIPRHLPPHPLRTQRRRHLRHLP